MNQGNVLAESFNDPRLQQMPPIPRLRGTIEYPIGIGVLLVLLSSITCWSRSPANAPPVEIPARGHPLIGGLIRDVARQATVAVIACHRVHRGLRDRCSQGFAGSRVIPPTTDVSLSRVSATTFIVRRHHNLPAKGQLFQRLNSPPPRAERKATSIRRVTARYFQARPPSR